MGMTRMRWLRKKLGITQAELAQIVGIPQSRVSYYENGLKILPRDAERIAAALGLDVDMPDLSEFLSAWVREDGKEVEMV